ncbi:MAG: menaquinol oxidoreductase [Deltaproteobacteria bacterium]|nr:menaquinol oxidoreductase [Deltaproteobacteria bacterium]
MDFFKRHFLVPLIAVLGLVALAYIGVKADLTFVFGVVIPYLAVLIFFEGLIFRIISWARSPVPFKIPSTCAQGKSLPWIKRSLADKLDNPENRLQVFGRMALEILTFRSLFRNTRSELQPNQEKPEDSRLIHWSYKWLWLGAIAFHYAFLIVILRHIRFFTQPVPHFVTALAEADGFVQFYIPTVYLTGVLLVVAVTYLLARRLYTPTLRYISLAADYFPLLLIMAIGLSGILMRYFYKVDIAAVKQLAVGLATLRPVVPDGIGVIFYIHLFLVCVLFAYFPFSKLMHAPGVFFSPSRNTAGDNRWKLHVNPWNYPVKFHDYMHQEDDYREAMIEAGLPVEKEK